MYKSFSFPGNLFTIYSHSDGLPIFAVLPHRMKLQEKNEDHALFADHGN